MAFLIGAAIRTGVKAVRQGVQAHEDFKQEGGPTERLDRWGNPKQHGPVYGMVMKAENAVAKHKGKGKEGQVEVPGVPDVQVNNEAELQQAHAEREERKSMDKTRPYDQGEDYGPQDYSRKPNEQGDDAPPSYDAVMHPGLEAPRSSTSRSTSAPARGSGSRATPLPPQDANGQAVQPQHQHHRSSSLSSESSSDDEDDVNYRSDRRGMGYGGGRVGMGLGDARMGMGLGDGRMGVGFGGGRMGMGMGMGDGRMGMGYGDDRRARKAERRVLRAERRALRARMRADRAVGVYGRF